MKVTGDRDRACVMLLRLPQRPRPDCPEQVAEDQSRGLRIACDLPDDIRSCVQRVFDDDADRHVQDQQVGAARELGKAGIGAGLIRPKDDRTISDPDVITKRRDVSMGHAKRR